MSSRPTVARLLLALSVALSAMRCDYRPYYVSPTGDDAGDGSRTRPWRSVQHALNNIDYVRTPPPKLYLLPGEYAGAVTITRSISMDGTDQGQVTLLSESEAAEDYVVTVRGDIDAKIENLRISGRGRNSGLKFDSGAAAGSFAGDLFLHRVEVHRPLPFGVWLTGVRNFILSETRVNSSGELYSDVGLRVERSRGLVANFTGGDHIDHVVSIEDGSTVRVDTAQLTGSPIWYADGIRTFRSNVTILNSTITRPAQGAETIPPGQEHEPPYAGITVRSDVYDRNLFLRIENSRTSGFDVGLGIVMDGSRLKVEQSDFSGLSAAVSTDWYDPAVRPVNPVVDLGGGGLDSRGCNLFSDGGFFLDHRGPYDISARNNYWGVLRPPPPCATPPCTPRCAPAPRPLPDAEIEDRIRDRMDDPRLGRVQR